MRFLVVFFGGIIFAGFVVSVRDRERLGSETARAAVSLLRHCVGFFDEFCDFLRGF